MPSNCISRKQGYGLVRAAETSIENRSRGQTQRDRHRESESKAHLAVSPQPQLTSPAFHPPPEILRRQNVGQIRLLQDAEGGPLPLLSDWRAQRRDEVSRHPPHHGMVSHFSKLILISCRQDIPHAGISHHEEEQPRHADPAPRSSGHLAKGVCEIRCAPFSLSLPTVSFSFSRPCRLYGDMSPTLQSASAKPSRKVARFLNADIAPTSRVRPGEEPVIRRYDIMDAVS